MSGRDIPKEVRGVTYLIEVIGILPLAVGIVFIGGAPFWAPDRTGLGLGVIGGAVLAVCGAAVLLIARGMRRRRAWARALGVVLGFLCSCGFPVGTVVGVFIVINLLSPEARAWFAGHTCETGEMPTEVPLGPEA